MKKGGIIAIVIIIAVVICAVIGFSAYQSKNQKSDNVNEVEENSSKVENSKEENLTRRNSAKNEAVSNDEENENEVESNAKTSDSKTLVVYYSAQNHTKKVAEEIANELDADIFEIEPEEVYTDDDLDWTNSSSRVNKEHENESLRDVKLKTTEVPNWDQYDTVLIGYPIWWGIAAWPTNSFVKANNFERKTVYAFCTSLSSGLGQSMKLLEDDANGGNWKEGHRFSSSASTSDIKSWVDSLGL